MECYNNANRIGLLNQYLGWGGVLGHFYDRPMISVNDDVVRATINDMIWFLADHLDGKEQQRMAQLCDRVQIEIFGEKSAQEIVVELTTVCGRAKGQLTVDKRSAVYDLNPIVCQGICLFFPPLLTLMSYKGQITPFVLVHELCHLLSLGTYREENGMLVHANGARYLLYSANQVGDGVLSCQGTIGATESDNESITDLAAVFFTRLLFPGYTTTTGGRTERIDALIRTAKRLGITQDELINAYFTDSHEVKGIFAQFTKIFRKGEPLS